METRSLSHWYNIKVLAEHTSSGISRRESFPCLFQLVAVLRFPCLCLDTRNSGSIASPLLSMCQTSMCLSLIRTLVVAFRVHPNKSVQFIDLKTFFLITYAKIFFFFFKWGNMYKLQKLCFDIFGSNYQPIIIGVFAVASIESNIFITWLCD